MGQKNMSHGQAWNIKLTEENAKPEIVLYSDDCLDENRFTRHCYKPKAAPVKSNF